MDCDIRRRVLTFAAFCSLLLAVPAASAYVRVFAVFQSGQHARVQTMRDGKPVAAAVVEVFRGFGSHGEFPDSKPIEVLTSDQSGWVTLPTLSDGKYLILAQFKPNLKDWLYLYVASEFPTAQPLTLSLAPQPPTLAERLAAAEGSTNVPAVSRLQGTVRDPAGIRSHARPSMCSSRELKASNAQPRFAPTQAVDSLSICLKENMS